MNYLITQVLTGNFFSRRLPCVFAVLLLLGVTSCRPAKSTHLTTDESRVLDEITIQEAQFYQALLSDPEEAIGLGENYLQYLQANRDTWPSLIESRHRLALKFIFLAALEARGRDGAIAFVERHLPKVNPHDLAREGMDHFSRVAKIDSSLIPRWYSQPSVLQFLNEQAE